MKKQLSKCFKLPNELILDQSLQYSHKKVCAAIYFFRNPLSFCVKSIKQIALKAGVSEATASRAIDVLNDKGYIIRTRNYSYHPVHRRPVYQKSSYVCPKPMNKAFTFIPNDIFSYDMRSSSFVLFTYLKMMIGNKNRAFPSLRRMMQDLGMAKSSICRCLKEQVSAGLIHLEHCLTKLGEFTQNSYFCIQNAEPKKTVKETTRDVMDTIASIFHSHGDRRHNTVEKTPASAFGWGSCVQRVESTCVSLTIDGLPDRPGSPSNAPLDVPFSILLL